MPANVAAVSAMSSARPRHPGLGGEARHAPELGEIVRDQGYVAGQGVGGDPEIVGADGLSDRAKMSTELAVFPCDVRVEIDDLDGSDEIPHGSEALVPAIRKPGAPLKLTQHDDRDSAGMERKPLLESPEPLHRVDAGIGVEHGSQSNGSRSSRGSSPLRISGVAASKSSGNGVEFRK